MDGDLVLPTGGWNGWSLRIYDLATVLTKGECVVWADMGKCAVIPSGIEPEFTP